MNMLRITDLKIDNKSLGDKFLLVDEYSTHSEPHRPALRATYSII